MNIKLIARNVGMGLAAAGILYLVKDGPKPVPAPQEEINKLQQTLNNAGIGKRLKVTKGSFVVTGFLDPSFYTISAQIEKNGSLVPLAYITIDPNIHTQPISGGPIPGEISYFSVSTPKNPQISKALSALEKGDIVYNTHTKEFSFRNPVAFKTVSGPSNNL